MDVNNINTFTKLINKNLLFLFIFHLFIFPTYAYSSSDTENWLSDSTYFDKRAKYFRVFYSGLNINTTRAVHAVGKHSYNLIIKFDGIAIDAAEGFGVGGPKMAAIYILKSQSVEAAMLFLNMFNETPQQLSRELSNKAMKDGIRAMNANYKLYKYGIDNLSSLDKKLFRKNQILVDLLGSAKKLYNKAGEDRETFTKNDELIDTLAQLNELINKKTILGYALLANKALTIIERANFPLNTYKPFVMYTNAINEAHALNYDPKKSKNKTDIKDKRKIGLNKVLNNSVNPANISLSQCVGGGIRECRKYCYQTCDHNKDNGITLAGKEQSCYSSCNKSCDLECITKSSKNTPKNLDSWPKKVNGLKGKRFRTVVILFRPEGKGNFDKVGLRILGPDGTILTCSSLGEKSTSFGKCRQRLLLPDSESSGKVVVEEFGFNKSKPGSYTFDFYVPDDSDVRSVEIMKDSMIVVPGAFIKPEGLIIKAGYIKNLIQLTIN